MTEIRQRRLKPFQLTVTGIASAMAAPGGGGTGGLPTSGGGGLGPDGSPVPPIYPEQVATPTFDPASGTVVIDTDLITISCATPGATIHYTLDGSTPTRASAVYSGALTTAVAVTVTAFAVLPGALDSAVSSAAYLVPDYVYTGSTLTFSVPQDSGVAPTYWQWLASTLDGAFTDQDPGWGSMGYPGSGGFGNANWSFFAYKGPTTPPRLNAYGQINTMPVGGRATIRYAGTLVHTWTHNDPSTVFVPVVTFGVLNNAVTAYESEVSGPITSYVETDYGTYTTYVFSAYLEVYKSDPTTFQLRIFA